MDLGLVPGAATLQKLPVAGPVAAEIKMAEELLTFEGQEFQMRRMKNNRVLLAPVLAVEQETWWA